LPPGVPKTYAALGAAALGPAFRPVVGALACLEFGGGATLTLAVVYKQAGLLIRSAAAAAPFHLAAAVFALLLPALALPSWRRLSPLSAVGCVSTAAVAVAVMACVVDDPLRQRYGGGGGTPPPPHAGGLRPGIVRAAGIFSMAVSGHSSLPSLRASMADPTAFPRVLDAAFTAMGLAYAATGAFGYWYWGDASEPVVTANLATSAPFASRFLGLAVGWAVLANALTTLPSMVMVVEATLWSLTPWARGVGQSGWACRPGLAGDTALRRPRRWFRFVSRAVVAGMSSAAGVAAASRLGAAVALVGGLAALACSLILPTVCYARVVGVSRDAPWRAAGLLGLLAGGVALTALIVVQSVGEMARQQ